MKTRSTPDGLPVEQQPKWRRDFPIDWPQDEYVSRRDLVKLPSFIAHEDLVVDSPIRPHGVDDRREQDRILALERNLPDFVIDEEANPFSVG